MSLNTELSRSAKWQSPLNYYSQKSREIKKLLGIVILYAALELSRQNLNEEECGW